jgi:hypothetical protein
MKVPISGSVLHQKVEEVFDGNIPVNLDTQDSGFIFSLPAR